KSTSSNINNNYSRLFPTVFLSYDVNEKNNLSFSYTNRINRPPYEFLDPFKWYTSEVSYSTGNPFLIPYYTTN
ncbi:outer membrane beta-barrel protein, partial [Vibrio parahaemolyticus]